MSSRKALGKGLSALIPEADELAGAFFQCPVEAIEPNPYQPRKRFGEKELEELAASVKEKGILTPLLVSKAGESYRLIAGERRWRAAQKAGLAKIPVTTVCCYPRNAGFIGAHAEAVAAALDKEGDPTPWRLPPGC